MAQIWKSSILFLKYRVSFNINPFLSICVAEAKHVISRVLIVVAVQLLPCNVIQLAISNKENKKA